MRWHLRFTQQDMLKFSMCLVAMNMLGWVMLFGFFGFGFFFSLFFCEQLTKSQHSWQILAQLTNRGIGSQFVPTYNKVLVALPPADCSPRVSLRVLLVSGSARLVGSCPQGSAGSWQGRRGGAAGLGLLPAPQCPGGPDRGSHPALQADLGLFTHLQGQK